MDKLNYHVACATRNTVVGLAVAFCDEVQPRGKSSMHCQYPLSHSIWVSNDAFLGSFVVHWGYVLKSPGPHAGRSSSRYQQLRSME